VSNADESSFALTELLRPKFIIIVDSVGVSRTFRPAAEDEVVFGQSRTQLLGSRRSAETRITASSRPIREVVLETTTKLQIRNWQVGLQTEVASGREQVL